MPSPHENDSAPYHWLQAPTAQPQTVPIPQPPYYASTAAQSYQVPTPAQASPASIWTPPPSGAATCANCDASTSPEWRRGPSGHRDLCNACGIRFARGGPKSNWQQSQRVDRRPKRQRSSSLAATGTVADRSFPSIPPPQRRGQRPSRTSYGNMIQSQPSTSGAEGNTPPDRPSRPWHGVLAHPSVLSIDARLLRHDEAARAVLSGHPDDSEPSLAAPSRRHNEPLQPIYASGSQPPRAPQPTYAPGSYRLLASPHVGAPLRRLPQPGNEPASHLPLAPPIGAPLRRPSRPVYEPAPHLPLAPPIGAPLRRPSWPEYDPAFHLPLAPPTVNLSQNYSSSTSDHVELEPSFPVFDWRGESLWAQPATAPTPVPTMVPATWRDLSVDAEGQLGGDGWERSF